MCLPMFRIMFRELMAKRQKHFEPLTVWRQTRHQYLIPQKQELPPECLHRIQYAEQMVRST